MISDSKPKVRPITINTVTEKQIQILIDAWYDGVLIEDEKTELEAALLASPQARDLFRETADIHALLCLYAEERDITSAGIENKEASSGDAGKWRKTGVPGRFNAFRQRHWWSLAASAAAAVALLLMGMAICWSGRSSRSLWFDLYERFAGVPPVRIIHQSETQGVEIPRSLPGFVQMESGELTVRLSSGVELTLTGQARILIENNLSLQLINGRLLADVPVRAVGFTVHAPGLTAEDLGTIFSVSTINGVSDVFVFKGSVQVKDAKLKDAGLCVAGEGACSRYGKQPRFFSADRFETEKLFTAVRGRAALKNPAAAFDAVEKIADQWIARYTPDMIPGSVPGLRGVEDVYSELASDESGSLSGRSSVAGLRPVVSGVSKRKIIRAKNLSSPKKENEMNTTKTVATLAAAAVMGVAGAARAVPEVSSVTMAQRSASRIVDIGYTLAGEQAIVTLSIETNGVALPDSAVTQLSGDVCKVVQPGSHSIVWNAGADWPEHSVTDARAVVTAWQTNSPPQCCVVDLSGGSTAETYPVKYYPSVNSLPYGGITNEIYKSSRLVMNKLSAGAFNMGEGVCAVTLTQDFYAGVFEVTQGQWYQVMNAKPSNFNDVSSWQYRPVEMVSYNDIRGSSAGAGWPTNNSVDADSFIGKLREKAGLAGFDLPTEAQWEYACRAGTTTYYNDGLGTPADTTSNAQMDVLGRYKFNGGHIDGETAPAAGCGPENGTAIVGSYVPNAWGLYDMHGNVFEWCLDWYAAELECGTDPAGADSGSNRVRRGGGWNLPASDCRSANRGSGPPSDRGGSIGFRLVRPLP